MVSASGALLPAFPPSAGKARNPTGLGPHPMSLFNLNYLLKALSPTQSHWGLVLQHGGLEGHAPVDSICGFVHFPFQLSQPWPHILRSSVVWHVHVDWCVLLLLTLYYCLMSLSFLQFSLLWILLDEILILPFLLSFDWCPHYVSFSILLLSACLYFYLRCVSWQHVVHVF